MHLILLEKPTAGKNRRVLFTDTPCFYLRVTYATKHKWTSCRYWEREQNSYRTRDLDAFACYCLPDLSYHSTRKGREQGIPRSLGLSFGDTLSEDEKGHEHRIGNA